MWGVGLRVEKRFVAKESGKEGNIIVFLSCPVCVAFLEKLKVGTLFRVVQMVLEV